MNKTSVAILVRLYAASIARILIANLFLDLFSTLTKVATSTNNGIALPTYLNKSLVVTIYIKFQKFPISIIIINQNQT